MKEKKVRLKELFDAIEGKHIVSKYAPPRQLTWLMDQNKNNKRSFYLPERFSFINRHIKIRDTRIADIGANLGFFSFEAIDAGAKSSLIVEGDLKMLNFMKKAAAYLKYEKFFEFKNIYLNFNGDEQSLKGDICILFNVLHHIGDDFGNIQISKEEALIKIKEALQKITKRFQYLVFQMGYNWKGNINLPLFKEGTKEEQIDFVNSASKNFFDIVNIGIAEKDNEEVTYKAPTLTNLKRQDELGEFLNRPIFILKAI